MAISVKIDDAEFIRVTRRLVKTLKRPLTRSAQKSVGSAVVSEMKDLISRGKSPIQGRRNFPAYRGSYRDRIRKGKIPGKSLRPVNLKLNGDFLDDLTSKASSRGFGVGFFTSESEKKEQGHREGTNGQAERPIIPQGREIFVSSVRRIFANAIRKAVERQTRS